MNIGSQHDASATPAGRRPAHGGYPVAIAARSVGTLTMEIKLGATASAFVGVLNLALPLLREDRATTFECATVGGDPATLEPEAAPWIERYDAAIAALEDASVKAADQLAVDEYFSIRLPNGTEATHAEVRKAGDGSFAVWVIDPRHPDGEYRSAWSLPSFESAVRNIMDVIWDGFLPMGAE